MSDTVAPMRAPIFCFTSDLDWASEYCIRDLRSILGGFGIRPTLFVTHRSTEVASWEDAEKAVHPNFFPGSSHGSSANEVIDHVFSLVPSTESYRCHRFFDSSPLTQEMRKRGIRYDSNLCLHLQPEIVPLRHSSGLMRFPVFFEDDAMWQAEGSWDMDLGPFFTPGLKILNFHSFMLAINCPDAKHYESMRPFIPTLDESTVASAYFRGTGERTFLLRLLREIQSRGFRFNTLGEVFRMSEGNLQPDQVGRHSVHSDDEYRRYWSLDDAGRQEFVRNSYRQRDATDPYATSRDFNVRELEVQSLIENSLPGRIVDLGCGNGFTLLRVAEKVQGEMTGIDFSSHLIEGAEKLASASGLANRPKFLCADAIEHIAGTAADSCDCIITERFIQNLPSQEKQRLVMSHIFRALKPGGRALICEGSDDGFEKLNDLREAMGLTRIAATSADNITAIRLRDAEFEGFCKQLGFALTGKRGYSWFFIAARVLHPLLVAPEAPRFDAPINNIACEIQRHLPFDAGYGGNTLWVFTKVAA